MIIIERPLLLILKLVFHLFSYMISYLYYPKVLCKIFKNFACCAMEDRTVVTNVGNMALRCLVQCRKSKLYCRRLPGLAKLINMKVVKIQDTHVMQSHFHLWNCQIVVQTSEIISLTKFSNII